MHPREFWWFYEAKMLGVETREDKYGSLYKLLKAK
jgi:hypothetical protein